MAKKVLKKFGKYLLLDRLAQGGMAEIFRAWAPAVDGGGRLLALKCVQSSYGEDPEFIQMFRSEIRVTMGLNHPNIVQLFDFGEYEGRPFIAMELVEGKNFRQFITRVQQGGQLVRPEHAAYIVGQAAAGLHFAHTLKDRTSGKPLNIVHRDISPQNLLLSYEGNAKIIDFGIAKAASNRQATRAGIIKGKPSYLSPEQIEGDDIDGRSDVFSLGAVLWETLTGKKLFTGDTDISTIKMIQECDKTVKPPSKLNPAVIPELDEIVFKALTKDRAHRYASAEEMQRALHRFIYAHNPGFEPSEFAKYVQNLFKAEQDQEMRMVQEVNAEINDLLANAEPYSESESMPGQGTQTKIDERKERPRTFTADAGALEAVPVDLQSLRDIKRPARDPWSASRDREQGSGKTPRPSGIGPKAAAGASEDKKKAGSFGKLLLPILALAGVGYYLLPQGNSPAPAAQTRAAANPMSAAQGVRVALDILPAGGSAQILLNGQPVDPAAIKIPSGSSAKLSVSLPGFKPFEQNVVASPGRPEIQVHAVLEPEAYGEVTLRSTPTAQAHITQGGMSWDHDTPFDNLKLPPGQYQVTLVNQLLGMQKQLSFVVQAGKNVTQEVNLELVH